MKLATIRHNGANRAARVDGEELVLLPFDDVGSLLASGPDWAAQAAADGETLRLDGVSFAPLVPRPEKIFCVGLNYHTHAAEANLTAPDHPTLFAKFSRALIGAGDDIVLPPTSNRVDWEVELTAVIGKPLRYAKEYEVQAGIAGYTIANDVSMRDWQTRTSQFLAGKTFEASTPLGPYLVTPDEAGDGTALQMDLAVNGETRQHESTNGMIFSVNQLVADISSIITLMPGDLILTGTCAGVGHCMSPQQYLVPGAIVEATIEGLGSQRNLCVAEHEVTAKTDLAPEHEVAK
jgi:acylpyruvate hydrolase